jgi:hypothetical protein
VNSESDTNEPGKPTGTPGLGRKILLAVGVSVIVISGFVGAIIGGNGAAVVPESAILGTALTIPTSPVAMALYGMAVATLVLGTLFGLVELASRLEDAEGPEGRT